MLRSRTVSLLAAALIATPPGAFANPQGGQVVGGAASIQGQGTKTVTVTQASQNAIINWYTFNIGTGEMTQFVQPNAGAIALNRVTGGLGPSTIYGHLQSNGRIFLINPNGIMIGPGGVVNAAGFLASTNDIKNFDFMAGNYKFTIPGRPDASIVNLGQITAASGGFAALVAPGVRNAGMITANLGHVALASGNGFTLDFYGDKLITLQVGGQIANKVIDVATSQTLDALVKNEGVLKANGGQVALTAVAARHVVDSVINNKGVIEANSVGTKNGMIVLGAATAATKGIDAPKQTVKVSGTLSAAGHKKGQKGGVIQVTGEDIQVTGAKLDASGQAGGGTVLVGGDIGGGTVNPAVSGVAQAKLQPWSVANATAVSVDAASVIDASAKSIGDGGKVVVWSNQATSFAGLIKATGGANGGNGGFAEVSSHGVLSYTGLADLSAAKGTTGTLLLDPANVLICDDCKGGTIDSEDLGKNLTSADIVIKTDEEGEQAGNITVASSVSWTGAHMLTLDAAHNIDIKAPIKAADGGLTLIAGHDISVGGAVTVNTFTLNTGHDISATKAVNVGTFTLENGYWKQVASQGDFDDWQHSEYSLPAFSAKDFRITGGTFLRTAGGNGTDDSPYKITDIYGLQGIGPPSSALLDKHFVLGNNIDASGTANWNGGQGFVPIGNIDHPFTGTLDGAHHFNHENQGEQVAGGGSVWTIDNLTIAPTSSGISNIGLFGVNFGTIENIKINNASITANPNSDAPSQYVGTLVGQNFGLVSNVWANGAINGGDKAGVVAGGLVGINGGVIDHSSAHGNVVVGSNAFAGGLVGQNGFGSGAGFGASAICCGLPTVAEIYDSHASGNVTSPGSNVALGGLVGVNEGKIWKSHASGAVSGGSNSEIGGLVGLNAGSISKSFATGNVTAGNFSLAGGLVAENKPGGQNCADQCQPAGLAKIDQSYAKGAVTVGSGSVAGGIAGINQGTIANTYETGAVFGGGNSILGGLVAVNDLGGSVNFAFASGAVTGTGANTIVGGFVGVNGGTVTESQSAGAVVGANNSFLGGFVGINVGVIDNSTATASASVTGVSNDFIGGFVGVNFGTVDPSFANGAVMSGAGSVAGSFAGANASFTNFPPGLIPGSTFSTGTITGDDKAYGSVNGHVGPFIGLNAPSTLPTYPSIIGGCSSALCQIFKDGLLPPPSSPGNSATFNQQTPPNQQVALPTFTSTNTPILIDLPTGGPEANGGNGNGGNGGNGAKPNYGPPPGPGLGRTLDEQQYSGVPPPGETRFRTGEVVIQVVDTTPVEQVVKIAQGLGMVLISSQHLDQTHRVLYRFGATGNADVRALIRAFEKNKLFASAEPNYVFVMAQSSTAPTDPAASDAPAPPAGPAPATKTGQIKSIPPPNEAAPDLANSGTASLESLPAGDAAQYVIGKFHLDAVHRLASGRNVTIAVIDSEIDVTHPDLRGVIVDRFDATQSPSHPHPHGTAMAGAIGAHTRLLGVAPSARILAIKTFDESGMSAESTSFQIIKGLDYAVAKNVRIINMSFAGPRDPMMERTLKAAHDKSIVLIAAAGNAGPKSPPLYPGADPSVIAVSATDYNDKPFAMANRGKYIAVAAPGVDVMVPAPGSRYELTTGTSVAAAHVSGVAALLVERNPTITPDEVRAVLMRTATAFSAKPKGEEDGAGLVDPVGALKVLTGAKTSEILPSQSGAGTTVH